MRQVRRPVAVQASLYGAEEPLRQAVESLAGSTYALSPLQDTKPPACQSPNAL